MKNIFVQGDFNNYRTARLDKAREPILEHSQFAQRTTTVFISHKHDDLADLEGIIGFLEQQYGVKVYIDSRDPSMPQKTSGETASKIKKRIEFCDKFILLATNGAIDSKWCNWELGYGDAHKYQENIALFPMQPKGSSYTGNEYMEIYPYIVERSYGDTYSDGSAIKPGYYVRTKKQDGSYSITPLREWLKK